VFVFLAPEIAVQVVNAKGITSQSIYVEWKVKILVVYSIGTI